MQAKIKVWPPSDRSATRAHLARSTHPPYMRQTARAPAQPVSAHSVRAVGSGCPAHFTTPEGVNTCGWELRVERAQCECCVRCWKRPTFARSTNTPYLSQTACAPAQLVSAHSVRAVGSGCPALFTTPEGVITCGWELRVERAQCECCVRGWIQKGPPLPAPPTPPT